MAAAAGRRLPLWKRRLSCEEHDKRHRAFVRRQLKMGISREDAEAPMLPVTAGRMGRR